MQKILLSAEGSYSKLKKEQNNRADNFFETNFVNTDGPKKRRLSSHQNNNILISVNSKDTVSKNINKYDTSDSEELFKDVHQPISIEKQRSRTNAELIE